MKNLKSGQPDPHIDRPTNLQHATKMINVKLREKKPKKNESQQQSTTVRARKKRETYQLMTKRHEGDEAGDGEGESDTSADDSAVNAANQSVHDVKDRKTKTAQRR